MNLTSGGNNFNNFP